MTPNHTAPTPYQSEITAWQHTMESKLRAADGWLTLIGVHWLHEGDNTIGSADECDIQLPARSAPDHLGVITFADGSAHLQVTTEAVVTVDGIPTRSAELRDDLAKEGPSLIQIGSLTFFVIRRADLTGVRVRDKDSESRVTFAGRHWFPTDPAYKVHATFTPHASPRSLPVSNSVGLVVPMTNPGFVEFTLQDHSLRLEAFEAPDDQWWFIFKDGTSGTSTYGAGRFLVVPRGKNGVLWIDFNRAYLPPCAFNHYATCPLAPPENVLPVAVEAGERL